MSPTRALRPCASPACPELISTGRYCQWHRQHEDQRPNSTDRGYGPAWRKTRARYLRSLDPLACENCGRGPDEAGPLEVDHIDGLGPNGPRGHDPTNLQALCKPCHSTKTAYQTNRGGAHD